MSLTRLCLRVSPLQSVRDGTGKARGGLGATRRLLCRGIFGKVAGKSQSKVLSSPEDGITQLEVLDIKPEFMDDYIELASKYIPRMVQNADIPVSLIGAWTTLFGTKTNQTTHLWEFKSYDHVSQTAERLREDKEWKEFTQTQGKYITGSSKEIILPFTFFHSIESSSNQERSRIFELRTYQLKPGCMIEWGQEWAKGIQYRREEAVGGWFSQVGNMHHVYHLWVYKGLQDRNNTRQSAWKFPGWDECVRRTVPLIQTMESSILLPTPYSPLQ